MEDSIFTQMIKGEIPCHKVYEDNWALAFMDIYPAQPGMVLVVSKTQVDHFMDLPDEAYQGLMMALKKVAQRMHQVLPDKRVAVRIEGLDVAHAHIKVFPAGTPDEFHARQDTTQEPDHDALTQMAEQLKVEGN
jgi:histidine triad (HIT) family protein